MHATTEASYGLNGLQENVPREGARDRYIRKGYKDAQLALGVMRIESLC